MAVVEDKTTDTPFYRTVPVKIAVFTTMTFLLNVALDALVHGLVDHVFMDAAKTTAMASPVYGAITSVMAWARA